MRHTTIPTKTDLFDTIFLETEIGNYEFEITNHGLKPVFGDYDKFVATFKLRRQLGTSQIGELFRVTNPRLKLAADLFDEIMRLKETNKIYNTAIARITR